MRTSLLLSSAAALVAAASLDDICSVDSVRKALPSNLVVPGILIDHDSVQVHLVQNQTARADAMYPPSANFDYCNVTFSYCHLLKNDHINVQYWLPDPANFKNRFLATGGGGYAINSGSSSVTGGVVYGAAAGLTDGGFGGFDKQFDSAFLKADGSVNWDAVTNFGYLSIHEMTVIGKQLTKNVYNVPKLFSYYQGCSEGGREGVSQVQRYPDQYDGVILGAPALRYAFQQANHLTSNLIEQTNGYFPSPCEFDKILNETLKFCDPLDGKTDGVVSRTDLCKLKLDLKQFVGMPWSCAASSGSGSGPIGGSSAYPAQNGTVTPEGVKVAEQILDGLHDSQGKRAYFSYQPSATFADAGTNYNGAHRNFFLRISTFGGGWVSKFLDFSKTPQADPLNGATYDTLRGWMVQGLMLYGSTLEATEPNLAPFRNAGGKILHYHGESDNSIPAASSVRYWESVRSTVYPFRSYRDGADAQGEWYKFFLVPGAGHCGPSATQTNGPWPQTNLQVLIDWVEGGHEPKTLNSTVLQGPNKGQNQQLCQWPLRPLWDDAQGESKCVYDQPSVDSWHYDLDSFPFPVY